MECKDTWGECSVALGKVTVEAAGSKWRSDVLDERSQGEIRKGDG